MRALQPLCQAAESNLGKDNQAVDQCITDHLYRTADAAVQARQTEARGLGSEI